MAEIKGGSGRLEDLPLHNASALAPGVIKRIVFGPGQHWDDYVVRYFILPPGESIPPHTHDWDHFVVAVRGHGQVVVEGVPHDLPELSWGHVPPGVEHVFANVGEGDFAFFCIVPTHGDPHAKKTRMRAERAERKEQEPS